MSSSTTNRVTEKIFIGLELTMDLKIQLNKSSSWKQAEIEHAGSDDHLKIIHFNNTEYIGKYVSEKLLTVENIQQQANHVKVLLEGFVPGIATDELSLAIFPQVFIS